MADPFVAEIRIFGFNFAPSGWALCNGQILPISQNTALFSLLGNDLRRQRSIHLRPAEYAGQRADASGPGPGLVAPHDLGEMSGVGERYAARIRDAAPHPFRATPPRHVSRPRQPRPTQSSAASRDALCYSTTINIVQMAPQALTPTGGSLPHNNMMPYLTLNFCIALQGVFPPRT